MTPAVRFGLRRESVEEITRFIGELRQVRPMTERIQEQIRQFEERRRQIQDLDRDAGLQWAQPVPAYVSLSCPVDIQQHSR